MKKIRGFTLVELLATLTVAAILLTVGVPSMQDLIRNNRLTAATNLIVSSLNIARSEAIKQGRNASVCVSDTQPQNTCSGNNWQLGWLTWVDINQNGNLDFPQEVLRVVEPLANSIQITTAAPLGQASFRIDPQGNVNSANTTLELCDDRTGETGRLLRVMATGGISLDSQHNCV
jgi:type IV fimbrial biogenesis protein FimT